MHVLVTGHTGFKGAWLTLLLKERGFTVSGIALDPLPESLFERARVSDLMENDVRLDVRDSETLAGEVRRMAPDAIFHLAAQPLVRTSYDEPRLTVETNVMGTLNILETLRISPSVRAALLVTTDKVYRNVGSHTGYREEDCLGGTDPYSASKAMADLLITSWTASFPGCSTAVARAGNVIGGGDISADRLIPDIVRAFSSNSKVHLRNPEAIRPWQHVLDCLHGYTLLLTALLGGTGEGAWNFGPESSAFRTVRETADLATGIWPQAPGWETVEASHQSAGQRVHEAQVLTLDAGKARKELGWADALNFDDSVRWAIEWELRVAAGEDPRAVTLEQIASFEVLTEQGA